MTKHTHEQLKKAALSRAGVKKEYESLRRYAHAVNCRLEIKLVPRAVRYR